MYETLALLAVFALVYSAVAGRVERTWISGPMLFVAFGFVVGPVGFRMVGMEADAELLGRMAELTLALVLFTDAAGTDLAVLRRIRQLPARLLIIGLPLTILLGFGAGELMFGELSALEVALLATMLAPTDAALGKAVIANESVPMSVRQGLNVESGLNDGICVPILLLFLALIEGQGGDAGPWHLGVALLLEEVGIGLGAGLVLSAGAAGLLRICHHRGWLSQSWIQVTVVALAFSCFGMAQALGGSGFIASFVGGLFFSRLLSPHHLDLLHAAEGIGDAIAMLTWILFGSLVLNRLFGAFDVAAFLYAVLSLTVIRMLPVYLSLWGLDASRETKLFIGWFGPRGLASIVFIIIVLEARVPGVETMATVVSWTVLLSVIGHGVTANAWAKGLGARAQQE